MCYHVPADCGTAIVVAVPIPAQPKPPEDGHCGAPPPPSDSWGDSYSWWRKAGDCLTPGTP